MSERAEPADLRVRFVHGVSDSMWSGADPAGLLAALSAEPARAVLARSRTTETSLIDLTMSPGGAQGLVVRKRWWFPEPRDRLKGALRTTFLAPSPAARAFRAMREGGSTGFHPRALVAVEARRGGLLHECLLLLAFVPEARDLASFLVEERAPAVRRAVLADLARRIRDVHAAGVADGEMHPRNVLVADGRTWKVDCARQRLFRGGAPDRRRAHDLACLDVGLARLASPRERVRALEAYLGAPAPRSDVRRVALRVEKLRRRLAPREGRRLPQVP